MFLHIGSDQYVSLESVVMILDIKSILQNPQNLFFLKSFSQNSIEKLNPGGHLKSVILTENGAERRVHFSPISSETLLKRSGENQYRSIFNAESEHELR